MVRIDQHVALCMANEEACKNKIQPTRTTWRNQPKPIVIQPIPYEVPTITKKRWDADNDLDEESRENPKTVKENSAALGYDTTAQRDAGASSNANDRRKRQRVVANESKSEGETRHPA